MSLVNAYLLDVNVLLAYALPGHTDHGKAYRWFKEIGSKRFCTCAMTQSGFIRLLSNPAIYLERVSHEDALEVLRRFTARKEHRFWPMDVDYLTATAPLLPRISGHKQTTDAYLLGLAIHHSGKLATMDKAIPHLAGPDLVRHVELIA
jgi:uncharacterized protein